MFDAEAVEPTRFAGKGWMDVWGGKDVLEEVLAEVGAFEDGGWGVV